MENLPLCHGNTIWFWVAMSSVNFLKGLLLDKLSSPVAERVEMGLDCFSFNKSYVSLWVNGSKLRFKYTNILFNSHSLIYYSLKLWIICLKCFKRNIAIQHIFSFLRDWFGVFRESSDLNILMSKEPHLVVPERSVISFGLKFFCWNIIGIFLIAS